MMESYFNSKGKLSLSIGEGFLTAYELSVLKPGDIVNSSKLAGEGYSLYYNGHFILTGEVVVLDKLFGVRVTSFLPPKGYAAAAPANPEEAIEKLPFIIRLGEIDVSLSELKGVGPGTIISLDTPYREDEDAELVVAGIPAAAGKVGVVYENMQIRITKVYHGTRGTPELEVRSSGNLFEKDYPVRYLKDYNFKRPDKFSRNAIDKMKGVHDLFIRSLRLKYGIFDDFEVTADQLNLGEFLANFPAKDYRYLLIQNRPWSRILGGRFEKEKIPSMTPTKFLLEPRKASHHLEKNVKDHIKRTVTGERDVFLNGLLLCLAKTDALQSFFQDQERQRFLLSALRGAWKNIADMNFQLTKVSDSMDDLRTIEEAEMILLLSVREKTSEATQMFVLYPNFTLHPYVGVLN
jgi:flagellar motor switch/type III secretory pathway protein FliN